MNRKQECDDKKGLRNDSWRDSSLHSLLHDRNPRDDQRKRRKDSVIRYWKQLLKNIAHMQREPGGSQRINHLKEDRESSET